MSWFIRYCCIFAGIHCSYHCLLAALIGLSCQLTEILKNNPEWKAELCQGLRKCLLQLQRLHKQVKDNVIGQPPDMGPELF